MTELAVISTAKERIGRPCIESVRLAGGIHHLTRVGPKPALANVWDMVSEVVRLLGPDAVVCWVDGDDWLRPGALDKIRAEYTDRPDLWMTWGSYVTADGKKGVSGSYMPGENVRRSEWRASHLKTFRAGLFQAIHSDELTGGAGMGSTYVDTDGSVVHHGWLTRAIDFAVMLPAIELAGLDRGRFIPDILYVYNWQASFEKNATVEEKRHERATADWIRGRAPQNRLEVAPWR